MFQRLIWLYNAAISLPANAEIQIRYKRETITQMKCAYEVKSVSEI